MSKQAEKWKSRIVRYENARVDQITANPKNFRVHPQHQRDALDGVIREVGVVQNVIINERTGNLVDGHLRVDMAIQNGEETVPATIVDLSESEEALILSTIDPLSALATTDANKLDELLREVRTNDQAIQELLTDLAENAGILPPQTGDGAGEELEPVEDDKLDELQKKWGTEFGQIWVVGKHRVMCGDSTDPDMVAELLQGEKPILMVTDPPYGVEYDPEWRKRAGVNNSSNIGKVQNDDNADWGEAYKLFDAQVAYIWHAGKFSSTVQESMEDSGFLVISQIIWAKPSLVLSRGDYHWQHEPCWYAHKKGKNHNWQGSRSETTLWEIEKGGRGKTGHGTEKPLECMARPIRNNTAEGELVCDPFLGSGTTAVACERNGRICYGMEIDPKYVAVILERLKAEGLEPRLEKEGGEMVSTGTTEV